MGTCEKIYGKYMVCMCIYIYNMHINYIAKSVFQVLEFLEMSCSQVIWTSLIAGFNFQPL